MANGPFDAYLQPNAQPHAPQPTGWEGNAGSIAYIGSKFLEGLRQSRMERAALAERENEKTAKAYENAIHFLENNKDIDPSIRQTYLPQIMKTYLGHVGGVKETSKDTGHPATDMLKNMAINIAGGPLPQAKAPLDMALIGQMMTDATNPANSRSQRLMALNAKMRDLVASGNINNVEALNLHPEYAGLHQQAILSSGDPNYQFDIVKSLAPDEFKHRQKQLQLGIIRGLESSGIAGEQPTPSTQPPPSAGLFNQFATPGTQGVSVSKPSAIQTPAGSTTPANKPANLYDAIAAANRAEMMRKYKSDVIGMALPPGSPVPKMEPSQTYADKNGARFNGQVLTTQFGQFSPGVYNEKGELVPDAKRAALYNPDAVNKQLTPEQVAQYTKDFHAQIEGSITDPGLKNMAKHAVQAQLSSNDLRGAGDTLQRFAQMQQTKDNMAQAQAIAAGVRKEGNDIRRDSLAMQVSQNFLNSPVSKNMITADQYANNANAAYAAIKAGHDPGIYDLELLRTWAKLTDIMTGVREGEYRDLASAVGRLRAANISIENFLDSTGKRIDDKMRSEVLASINRIRDNQYNQFETLRKQYDDQLGKLGSGGSPLMANPYAAPKQAVTVVGPPPSGLRREPRSKTNKNTSAPPPSAAPSGIQLRP